MTRSTDQQEHTMPQEQTSKKGQTRRWVLIVAAIGVGLFFANQALESWSHDLVAWRASFEEASIEAGENNKPLLVYFNADWCGPCKQMKAWVYSDKSVANTIEAGFIPVKIDLTTQGLPDQVIAELYDVQSIPTLITLTPNGRPLKRSVGYVNKKDFLAWMDASLVRYVKLKNDDQAISNAVAEVKTRRAE